MIFDELENESFQKRQIREDAIRLFKGMKEIENKKGDLKHDNPERCRIKSKIRRAKQAILSSDE